MRDSIRYLLLQVRDPGDPMREHEVASFARSLACSPERIRVIDLISTSPSSADIGRTDVVLLGGSGDYSVVEGGPWLERALDAMRALHESSVPTFASCWGFQALARAMGGVVVTDPSRAELGTREVFLTAAGERDPVFGPTGPRFLAQMGHQDIVDGLPDDAVLLASTDLVANQAFRFEGRPIYCTQFHPELDRAGLVARVRRYPAYVESIAGVPLDEFIETCAESSGTERLLERFVALVCP